MRPSQSGLVFFLESQMAKKQPRKRAPGGGRKRLYHAGTIPVSFRLPIEIVELLDGLGPNRQAALIGIVRTSVQYRMEFRAEKLS